MREPGLGARLRYYLGFRLPVEYREWVEADLASPTWPRRNALGRLAGLWTGIAIGIGISIASGGNAWLGFLIGSLVGTAIIFPILMWREDRERERALTRHRRLWGVSTSEGKS